MRPRPDAAENRGRLACPQRIPHDASMRPRPDAAENLIGPTGDTAVMAPRFNEAAARCRGKLQVTDGSAAATTLQ